MSVLQDTLIKVSSAIIVSVNDMLSDRQKKTCPDYKTLVPRLTDSVALIGHVYKEVYFKRRDAILAYLNQEFKQACSTLRDMSRNERNCKTNIRKKSKMTNLAKITNQARDSSKNNNS